MEFLRSYLSGAETYEQARGALALHGLSELGSGFSSIAYSIRLAVREEPEPWWLGPVSANIEPIQNVRIRHEDRVIRVSGRDAGMLATTKAALAHQADPYAPRIYEYQEFRGGHAVIMERLNHFRDYERPYDRRLWSTPGQDREARRALGPNETLRSISPYVNALCHAQVYEGGLSWDLHAHNVMRRPSDGHLVIQDPLVG